MSQQICTVAGLRRRAPLSLSAELRGPSLYRFLHRVSNRLQIHPRRSAWDNPSTVSAQEGSNERLTLIQSTSQQTKSNRKAKPIKM